MSSGLIPGGYMVIGQLVAPPGTRTLFHQAAPPLGWTQDVGASFSDTDMRVNNAGPSTGGSTVWSTWNRGGTVNANAITLGVGNLPVHNHTVNDPSHSHSMGTAFWVAGSALKGNGNNIVAGLASETSTNTVNTSWTSGFTGSGTSFTPTFTTPSIQFSSHIMGVKS